MKTVLLKLISENVKDCEIAGLSRANLKDIANAVISDLIMPFIRPALKALAGDKGFIYELPGDIQLNLEKIVTSLIKFISLSIIIFAMISYGVKIKKPTKWVEVRNFDKLVSALKRVKT